MKILLAFLLLAVIALLPAADAHAGKRPNVLRNGSFEEDFAGWERFVQSWIEPGGVCGAKSARLDHGYIRNTTFKLKPNQRYKLTFYYKGSFELSVTRFGTYHESADWKRLRVKFQADATGGDETLWILGTGHVDCFELVKLPKRTP